MQKKAGDIRKFTFDLGVTYVIREILKDPKVSMWWKQDRGTCPHCKRQIEVTTKHDLHTIEILGKKGIEDEKLERKDMALLGFSLDDRTLLLPEDKYDEVFQKSTKFGKAGEK